MTVATPASEAAWTLEDAAADAAAVSARLKSKGVSLDAEEVALLGRLLGRAPRWAEAVLFGILWSEHCSYKSTRHLLKRLPTQAPQVVIGPGEDAGVVALPEPCADTVLVLGHESHNHPSQVLPVEGAATGIGGIVRDIVCMGAEVVGVLDALRFGDPRGDVHTRDVMRGVVQGIADYGNALGVPNLGGDTVFDAGFDTNCLVNAMAVGLAPASGVLRSRVPDGPGPWVFVLIGKPTDESGFGGAAFASGELGEGDQRGAVQLPDPFLKRVLNVATALEARGYPAGVKAEIHLQIDDDLLKHNRGKFVLTVADGRATVRKGGKGDLQLDVRAFASMYASFLSPLELELMGCVSGKADTLALATTVFSGPVPWMNDHF